jgi:hypothetical protein
MHYRYKEKRKDNTKKTASGKQMGYELKGTISNGRFRFQC